MFHRNVGLNLQTYTLWVLRGVSPERLIGLGEWRL